MMSENVGVVAATMASAMALGPALLPNVADVRRSAPDDVRCAVRTGQLALVVLSVGAGGGIAYLMGSHHALTMSLLGALLVCAVYEFALRRTA